MIIPPFCPTPVEPNSHFLLEITEDEDRHEQRCQRNGVANGVHEMEPLKDLEEGNQTFQSFQGQLIKFGKQSPKENRCVYHFLALVVGIQVCGALGVVRPGSVDTGHLLPVTRRITLAVGPSWRPDHRPVCEAEEVLLSYVAGHARTSVVEVIDVLRTHDRDQLTRSALGPADDAVPLWDTVAVFTNHK